MRGNFHQHLAEAFGTIRRWTVDNRQRLAEWQELPAYWHLRQRRSNLAFRVVRWQFMVRSTAEGWRESVFVLGDLVRAISARFLLALVIVVGLEIADKQLFTQSDPRGRIGVLPHFFQRVWPDLTQLRFEPTAVVSYLATFVQVAGVFLGLYFAAVSLVVSAYTSNGAPDSVRDLLVAKLSHNGYIDLIAFFGATSTLLMAQTAIGLAPGTPNLILVTILAVGSVFGFVVLGVQTFGYLSPAKLAISLPSELTRWVDAAGPSGHRWENPSFQRYYQQEAERLLGALKDVFDHAISANRVSADAMTWFATAAIRLERWYAGQKSRIPTESHWFERVGKHRSWLTASEHEVTFLLATGWQGEQQLAQELQWFERHLEPLVESALRFLATAGHLEAAVSVMEVGRTALQRMARSFAVTEALRLSAAMERAAQAIFGSADIKLADLADNAEHARLALALHEGSCMDLTAIILGLTRAIEATTMDAFRQSVTEMVWNRPTTLYASEMPRTVIQQIELLADRLSFERDIEGRTVTPLWYQEQFVGRAFIAFVQTSVGELIGQLEEKFGSAIEPNLASGRNLFALQLVERGFEACQKASFLVAEAKSCDERMATLHRIPEEPWPESNWDVQFQRVKNVRRQLVQALGRCAPALICVKRHSEEWPDFFGYAHRILASECAAALVNGDEDLFAALIQPFFNSCLVAHYRLGEEVGNAPNPWKFVYISEPIADLLHVSGLAKIYSELNGTEFWSAVQQSWDKFLDADPDQLETMARLVLTVRFREGVLMIPPYQGIRSQWQAGLEKRLRDEGFLTDNMWDPVDRHKVRRVRHESPVIRALTGRSWRLRCDPEDVFVVTYLRRRPGGDKLELMSDQVRFEEQLRREATGTYQGDDEVE